MSGTHRPSPERSISLGSTITIAAKLLLVSTLAVIAFTLSPTQAHAQGSLSLGTVFVSDPMVCSSSGWYRYRNPATQQVYVMNCFGGQLLSCPNADNLNFTYASMNPVGIVPNVTQALGVVVFLTGSGGTAPIDENVTGSTDNELLYIGDYFTAGYVIVQLAWSTDWELTTIPNEATQPPTFKTPLADRQRSSIGSTTTSISPSTKPIRKQACALRRAVPGRPRSATP